MRIRYDAQVDALYIRLREGKIRDSDEIEPGMLADYGEDGKVMCIEVLQAPELTGGHCPFVWVSIRIERRQ